MMKTYFGKISKSLKVNQKPKKGNGISEFLYTRKNVFFLGLTLGALIIVLFALLLILFFLKPPETVSNFAEDVPEEIEVVLNYDMDSQEISGTLLGEAALYYSDSRVLDIESDTFQANAVELEDGLFKFALRSDKLVYRFLFTPSQIIPEPTDAECASAINPSSSKGFVASKNSKLYHPVENCSFADRIKEENRVYFDSREEAESTGREPSSCFE
ncbi:hypothetical protein ACFL1U_01100 [Patescibacteria group bacterium]